MWVNLLKGQKMREVTARLSVDIPPELLERLRVYSKVSGVSVTRLVKDAVAKHLATLESGVSSDTN